MLWLNSTHLLRPSFSHLTLPSTLMSNCIIPLLCLEQLLLFYTYFLLLISFAFLFSHASHTSSTHSNTHTHTHTHTHIFQISWTILSGRIRYYLQFCPTAVSSESMPLIFIFSFIHPISLLVPFKFFCWFSVIKFLGSPCGSAGEESACNEGNLGLIPRLGRAPGERKGYPLQYSGLENSIDSIVHGVAKSQTHLSDFHRNKFTSNTVFSFILKDWCWEGLGARGEGDDRGWDGWMASLTQWTWISVNSGSWWWTGRPGVLWVMGSQRVGYDWATDLICLLFPSVPSPSLLLLFLFVFHIDGSLDHITALKRTNILSAVELAFCTYRILKHTQYILKNHSNLWNVKRKYFSYICNCNYQSPKCHSVHLTSKDPISTWVA